MYFTFEKEEKRFKEDTSHFQSKIEQRCRGAENLKKYFTFRVRQSKDVKKKKILINTSPLE